MLRFLKRWLGWGSDSGPFDFGDSRIGTAGRSSALSPRPQSAPPSDPQRRASPASQPPQTQSPPNDAAPRKPQKERSPADVLDDPRLTLDRPNDDGFDPYNTGAFNRSTSWERIGRHKR